MTLAPQSASCRTQVGPARTRVRSSTVKRVRACEARGKDIESSGTGSINGSGLYVGRLSEGIGISDRPTMDNPSIETGRLAIMGDREAQLTGVAAASRGLF